MRIRYKGRDRFHKAVYEESSRELQNPGCGWYHVYTFQASPPLDGRSVAEEIWLDDACRRERIALVLIDIGFFQSCDISKEALSHIKEIMDFFRREQKQVILRAAYDIRGDGMVREPLSISLVKRHMEQIGDVICHYLTDILVVQGIFVGSWGEMHGSRFLDRDSMVDLVNTMYRVTKGGCFLAVRTPAQWRQIVNSQAAEAGIRQRLALFNDGIFGSSTDLGTYGTISRTEAGENEKWNRKEEQRWQEQYLAAVPNGGEVLLGQEPVRYRQAAETFKKMHLSYLNSIYHQEQLEVWKEELVKGSGCWAGINGYDYIGRHLGYRFVIRNVAKKKGGRLEVTIVNCGFSNLTEETDCFLLLEEEGRQAGRQRVAADARDWKCGQKTKVLFGLPLELHFQKRVKLFLRLERRADRMAIRFANQGAGEQFLLGEFEK